MNRFACVVLGVCCAAPAGAQQDLQVFAPSRQSDAPLYVNGQVVRVNRAAGTLTLRTDGGVRVLNVDRQTLDGLGNLRAGSGVILGFRVSGQGASERRTVSEIRPSVGTVTSGSRGSVTRGTVTAFGRMAGPQSMGAAQVVSVDASARRMTVVDSAGATRVLDVRGSAVSNLRGLRSGDVVSLGVASPLVARTPAGTVTLIGATSSAAGELSFQPRGSERNPPPPAPNRGTPVLTNDSLPSAAGLPATPDSGINRNPASGGMQPVPGAQPLPGVQAPTGVQPAPNAQPLPGTGVTGQTAPNPGLAPLPVPGTGGQAGVNAGASGGATTSRGTNANGLFPGVATTVGGVSGLTVPGARGSSSTGNNGRRGGGSPILGTGVPQLGGFVGGGINSAIPSIPPNPGLANTPVLPPPSVMPLPGAVLPADPNQLAVVRELAARDFDMAVAVLGARAAEVDRAWITYRGTCVTTTVPLNNRTREWFGVLDGSLIGPTEDLCEQSFNEVSRLAQGIEAGLDNARDAARRADVLPGRMRETLVRYNLDL